MSEPITVTVTGTATQGEENDRPIWSYDLSELDEYQVSDLLIDAVVRRSKILKVMPIDVLLHAVYSSQEAAELRSQGAVELRIPLVRDEGAPPPVPGGVLH